ncbi:DNA repair protein RadA [Oryza brachyantha]|uniref:RecA family profile 1 domain-containing protein n=1 Tax=Oryza brachyantha TaxID=4533 RepID=J3MBB9_ORYBR|nr:DNA repair protein RadA [Oryza brachyantha]
MPHPSAAMLPSPSSLRSVLHLSRRLLLRRAPDPRLPRPLLLTHLRLLSSTSSPSDDPLTDSLGTSAATSSSADSEAEAPVEGDAWGLFDPVAGRIVMQEQPPYSSPGSDEDAPKGKGKRSVREKGAGTGRSVAGKDQTRWSSVAGVRRAGGKSGKERVTYVCSNCGEGSSQWWGTCRHCEAMGTLTKYVPGNDSTDSERSHHAYRSWVPQKSKEMVPQSLQQVNKGVDHSEWRIPLSGSFGVEIARVLGGGIVPGSLILVGGDPGVGKSSLMLQLASIVSENIGVGESSAVVYVSGEESIEQIGNRASRMSIRSRNLYLYSSTDIEDILDKIQPLSPKVLIIDSIQTVYLRAFAGSAGNMTQVKECTSALLRFAKLTNIPVFLIGHVTKTGDIAGPRLLEHIVDVVLYMEGERCLSHRLLRSVKNRFGSTDEIGVFEMSGYGLQAVLNPTEMFLTEHDSDSEILAGLAVAVVLDGSRPFAIEVQALCISGSCSGGVVGIPKNRADIIISVLMKQAGLKLQDNAVFLNVVSGFMLTETAGDLAIAASICSSFLEYPIPNDIAFIGEIGLGGELRTVPRMDKRVLAIAKLGYKKCVVPKTSEKLLKPLNLDLEILPCVNLKEVINTIFRPQ